MLSLPPEMRAMTFRGFGGGAMVGVGGWWCFVDEGGRGRDFWRGCWRGGR